MPFCFDINISDKDYYNFNKFHFFKTHYTRSTRIYIRLIFILLILPFMFSAWAESYFEVSLNSFLTVLPYLLLEVIIQILAKPVFCLSFKSSISRNKKSQKKGYGDTVHIEFHEDRIFQTTKESTGNFEYTVIDSVYIDKNEDIYIFLNRVIAQILLRSNFKTDDEYRDFISFITSKTDKIYYIK